MKRDLSKLTDKQVIELARKEGTFFTKRSLAIFDNPLEFFVNKKDVDYEEAYRLLRQAMEDDSLEFVVGCLKDGDGLNYKKGYLIEVREKIDIDRKLLGK